MDDVDGAGEDVALQALTEAFAQARGVGYRPDSSQMRALERAEWNYQRAQRRRERNRAALDHPQHPDPGSGRAEGPSWARR